MDGRRFLGAGFLKTDAWKALGEQSRGRMKALAPEGVDHVVEVWSCEAGRIHRHGCDRPGTCPGPVLAERLYRDPHLESPVWLLRGKAAELSES